MDENLGGAFIVSDATLGVPVMVCAYKDAAYSMKQMLEALSDRKFEVIEVPLVYAYGKYGFNDE